MNDVVSFNFEGSDVRVISQDSREAFVSRDVALLLRYSDPDQAVRAHCKAVETWDVNTTGQVRQTKIIPERDVYRLIMRSKLPAAERFEEWVVGEVLPSIRKHGGYITGQESMEPAEVLARAAVWPRVTRMESNGAPGTMRALG